MAAWGDQQAFLAVVETGSLSAAARQLRLTQPTVRHRIEALEHATGTALFIRAPNGLIPTEQARELAAHVRTMHLASEAFFRSASGQPGTLTGSIRLSASDFMGTFVLPPMLRDLRQAHPKLAMELAISNSLVDLLGQEADIAIRMNRPKQAALVARQVGTVPLSFFAHVDYVARKGLPQSPEELTQHDLIGPDRAQADLAVVEAFAPKVGRQAFGLRTDSHPAQFTAIRSGLGIGVLQRPVGLRHADLVPVLPETVVHELPIWIVTHEDLRRTPRIKTVYDYLVQQYQTYCRSSGEPQPKAVENGA
ncbi:LysR family transcriptional regulator [Tianweitania sediminis]|jgi:DNA-binding transcriptional LysR family regulator|uniref:LysR family transcriptional regulator n=1 Tax=Tianweitania sediminis TaxID=1502156 RepID=A0A8J7QYT1_9HYPH|nr:LysR family transcriptional regulator [Tianweitania sediminis]MBP0437747.1 LysR family transcriptional regulator [Tianweitania sediminis]HEV7418005.1 LysR family transcriptional regulator [Tianweitania sediminis]